MLAARRFLSIAIPLILIVGAMTGCSHSIQGSWVRQDGTAVVSLDIDDEWITFNNSDEYRYEVDGKTSIRIERDGVEEALRWSREGDTLTLAGIVYYQSGSEGAKRAKTEAGESAVCESERERLLAGTLPAVVPDCPHGGGQYQADASYRLLNSFEGVREVILTCPKHGTSSVEKPL